MQTHRLRWGGAGILFLVIIVSLACRRAGSTAKPTPGAAALPTQTVSLPTVTAPAVISVTETATVESTAEATPNSSTEVTFQDVHFVLPAELASRVSSEAAAAADVLGEPYPAYTEFTLIDYDSKNTSFEPKIQIYPVSELGETATQTAQQLKDLLAEQPAALLGGLPILPTIPAGQLIDAQIHYLTFQSGSGVRALTQLGQASWPIHNEGLVYIFQGLTSDNRYYISAFLPVAAAFLPDHVDDPASIPAVEGISFPRFDSPNFDSEYARYQQAIIDQLNAAPAEDLVPSLGALDSLIESIQVETVTEPQDAETIVCVNALPTRLRVGLFAYVNPDPPLPNNLRREAGKENELLGEIPAGEGMKILEGPKCADGWVWWKVRTFENELTGWTAEGDREDYWLIPCSSREECRLP
jgi:hypothetical protein